MTLFIQEQREMFKKLLKTNPEYLKSLLLNMEYNSVLEMTEDQIKMVLKTKNNKNLRERLVQQRHQIWNEAFEQNLVEEICLPLIQEKAKHLKQDEWRGRFIFEESIH